MSSLTSDGSKYKYFYYDLAFGMGREAISYTELVPVMSNISEEDLDYSTTLSLGIVKMDIRPRKVVEFQNTFLKRGRHYIQ